MNDYMLLENLKERRQQQNRVARFLDGVLLIHPNLLREEVLNSRSKHIKEGLGLLNILRDLRFHGRHGCDGLVLSLILLPHTVHKAAGYEPLQGLSFWKR